MDGGGWIDAFVLSEVGGSLEIFANHFRGEKEVVVVDNDEVARAVDSGDFSGKEGICLVVVEPEGVGGWDGGRGVEPEEIVE